MSILEFFDRKGNRQPRDVQRDLLLQIERDWDTYDVFCCRLPTSAGKTLLGECIAAWAADKCGGKAAIVVPDNMLLQQMAAECHASSQVMFAQKFYTCTWKESGMQPREVNRATCPGSKYEEGVRSACSKKFTTCPYATALKKWKASKVRVSNYWMPQAHKMLNSTQVLVVDEAHNFRSFLAQMSCRRLWHHDYHYPLEATDYVSLSHWLDKELAACAPPLSTPPTAERGGFVSGAVPALTTTHKQRFRALTLMKAELETDRGKVTIESTVDDYRGQRLPCIMIKPLDVRDALPLAISLKHTRKIVLMSATLAQWDVHDIGLGELCVKYYDTPSPIPPERRPIYMRPCISNRVMDGFKDLQALVSIIEEAAARFPKDKGVVFVTYALGKALGMANIDEGVRSRLLFYTSLQKRAVLKEFMEAKEPKILVGAGITEGLDLKGDLARFGILAKIAWPNLGDIAVARKAEENPDWMSWQAARTTMQACGRVCRGPDDYGATYILDSSVRRIPDTMWLGWFREAIRGT